VSVFCQEVYCGKDVPRAVFFVINAAHAFPLGELFHPENL
jgi:hypothetical protein